MLVSFSDFQQTKKPFRFFNCWVIKKGFLESIRETWSIEIESCVSYQITQKLRLLKSKLKTLFGKEHLQMEVDRAHAELIYVQNQLHEHLGDPTLATQEQVAATHLHQLKKELETSLR